jgi:hypothetical protein
MQSGALETRTQNQKWISKAQHSKTSAKKFKYKCALVCRIHVSFGINQQLTCLCVTSTGSLMQSGASATRTENQKWISKTQYTQNQQQISNTNAAAEECSLTCHACSRYSHALLNDLARQRRRRFEPRQ